MGLGGNDRYLVDSAGDVVRDAVGGGVDTVFTQVDYTLGALAEVELLAAVGSAGSASIDLIGNQFVNWLQGNAGSNILNSKLGNDL